MIKYVGPAKEWMQESLTEYIQLIIVRKIWVNIFIGVNVMNIKS